MSTRKAIQEKRRRERQQRQRRTILIVSASAVVVALFLIFLTFRPVGDIEPITPRQLPNPDGLALGNPDAPVVLEEFSDFQCPSCKAWFEGTEPLLLDNYIADGQVYFIYRNFPILGVESQAAANASLCANEQGRFWDYHDLLFANQIGRNSGGFSDRRLGAFAESLGLDQEAFDRCLRENRYQTEVNQDFQAAQSLGIPGTPGIVLNGQLMTDSSFDALSQQIDALIAASGG